jgi:hypothetical protein
VGLNLKLGVVHRLFWQLKTFCGKTLGHCNAHALLRLCATVSLFPRSLACLARKGEEESFEQVDFETKFENLEQFLK